MTVPLPTDSHIEWTELTLRCDATLTVGNYQGQATEWMKPGAEGKVHMTGRPDVAQIGAAYDYLQNDVINRALVQVIEHLHEQLRKIRQNG